MVNNHKEKEIALETGEEVIIKFANDLLISEI